MELVPITQVRPKENNEVEAQLATVPFVVDQLVDNLEFASPFIEANTKEVTLAELEKNCLIPVFSKDNEKTISHQEFIEVVNDAVHSVFGNHVITQPEIRVSHQVKGRIPEAIHKPVKDLLDFEKTQFFERMAFIVRIPSIQDKVSGNPVSLTIGGVRAYNRENLYSRKTVEKFQLFVGFQNMVCCNLCIATDGLQADTRVGSLAQLKEKAIQLLQSYQMDKHIGSMQDLTQTSITDKQFAQLIGRTKLYQYLPNKEKAHLPSFLLSDNQLSTIAKDYYQDERFCKSEDGEINLWNVYNLFTSANKSSYIDTFMNRNANAFEFSEGLAKAINGDSSYRWFLR